MKFIVIAIILQILFALIMDLLYVKFDVLKWVSYDDVIFWLLMIILTIPLYFKGFLNIYKNKGLAVVLSVISFIVFAIISAILGLFFHSEILNAPL